MEEVIDAVILDCGSGRMKAGLAGYGHYFQSVVGNPTTRVIAAFPHCTRKFYGDDVLMHRGLVHIKHPIEHGVVNNWDDVENLLTHAIYTWVHTAPEEHPFLFTDTLLNPKSNREKMTQLLFEKLSVPVLYAANQAQLTLYGSGRSTGTVLDCGDGVTHSVSYHEGYPLYNTIQRIDVAGRALTNYLVDLLAERKHFFTTSAEVDVVRVIKEQFGYITLDAEQETKLTHSSVVPDQKNKKKMETIERSYELPDGQVFTIGNERFKCAEPLFNLKLLGLDTVSGTNGLHEMLHKSIMESNPELHKELYENIVLAGGTALFAGFTARLQQELAALAPPNTNINFTPPPLDTFWGGVGEETSAFRGASMLTSLPSFQELWITKEMYDEYGPQVIHKCF